jgi:hypothetical protein
MTANTECPYRFNVGDKVWVRDRCHHKTFRGFGGYSIVEATVREQHYHPDRHPFYPGGEGYALDGELWWDCYPGCRVFATRDEAVKARMSKLVA